MRSSLPDQIARSEFPLWGGMAVVASLDPDSLSVVIDQVKQTVAAFDLACSSFREDSEISRLNVASGRTTVVSDFLYAAVQAAIDAARETDGAVDPTVGEALIAHGINPSSAGGQSFRIKAVSGHGVVELDDQSKSISMPAGVRLDLGATAKALAADQAAAAAAVAAGCGVLVALLGDVSVAGEPPAGGWSIRVTDDHRSKEAPGQTIAIQHGGLATSSVTVRRAGGAVDGAAHLIDPATGAPVTGPWRTVTVHADSCLAANTASTGAIVMGVGALDWLAERRLAARLVSRTGEVARIAGWPVEGDDQETAA